MTLKQDGPYDSRTLTKVFALSSLALGAVTVWMVFDDHSREWKREQERFRAVDIAMAEARVQEADRAVNQTELAKAKDELKAAEEDLSAHSSDRGAAEKRVEKAQAVFEEAALTFSVDR